MSYIKRPELTSPTIDKVLEKLNKARRPPKVNLPALARRDERFMETWEADPGCVFISSDFVSLEPSITASFAEDPNYRYATYGGIGKEPYISDEGVLMIDDVYLMTASVMPGIGGIVRKYFLEPGNKEKWLTDKEEVKSILGKQRKQAKPACLGFNYGMGPKRFVAQSYSNGQVIELAEAKKMHKNYWKLFKGVKKLVQTLESYVKQNEFIVNPFGYRLTTEPYKGYNAYIQSSASGVLDVFCLKFFAAYPDAIFIAVVHDEVIYQIKETEIDKVKAIQDNCVKLLNEDLKFKVPMRLGFTIAKSFKEIK